MILNIVATVLVTLAGVRDIQQMVKRGKVSPAEAVLLSIAEGAVILWAIWR